MSLRKRPDWSRELPRTLVIPDVMEISTLADVRKLLDHLPAQTRAKETWQIVAKRLDAAARGGDIKDVMASLWLVLELERVPCQ